MTTNENKKETKIERLKQKETTKRKYYSMNAKSEET